MELIALRLESNNVEYLCEPSRAKWSYVSWLKEGVAFFKGALDVLSVTYYPWRDWLLTDAMYLSRCMGGG